MTSKLLFSLALPFPFYISEGHASYPPSITQLLQGDCIKAKIDQTDQMRCKEKGKWLGSDLFGQSLSGKHSKDMGQVPSLQHYYRYQSYSSLF